jgi:hypothetical protein
MVVKQINEHIEEFSSIAANRFLKKLDTNALYCNISLVEAFMKFETELLPKLSFSTFYKYVGNQFKKPHRFSDLCEYCEHYKVINLRSNIMVLN